MKRFKSGFTLIELVVVIGIIAVLMGALMSGLFGATESANSAKCLSNLRNLALAVQNYSMKSGYYPAAGSYEYVDMLSNGDMAYKECRGWIGWNSGNAYNQNGNSGYATASKAQSGWNIAYCANQDKTWLAITNGVLWKASSGAMNDLVCPSHKKLLRKHNAKAAWSYVMNSFFMYDYTGGGSTMGGWRGRIYGSISKPEKVLLFGELPFVDITSLGQQAVKYKGDSGDSQLDCTLQYDDDLWSGTKEYIGFNHDIDDRTKCANVAFADGHVDKIIAPTSGGKSHLIELTEWLCEGKSLTLSGGKYKEDVNEGEATSN